MLDNDDSRLTTVTPPNPAPAVSYTWDNNGNLTNRGADTFAWDVEDRMTSATVGGTATTTEGLAFVARSGAKVSRSFSLSGDATCPPAGRGSHCPLRWLRDGRTSTSG